MCQTGYRTPGPLTYESGVLPIALRGPAFLYRAESNKISYVHLCITTLTIINVILVNLFCLNTDFVEIISHFGGCGGII